MRYWSQYSRYNSRLAAAYTQVSPTKYILVDGGAAGALSEPFDIATNAITAVRFEPRGDSTINASASDIYIDGGLWSEDTTQTLHVAAIPSASSICPPNMAFLRQFDDTYGVAARQTMKTLDVRLRSIDSCVQNKEMPLPHFIKLDIHSAELPALLGAQHSLDQCVGLLVETWNAEVHKGQSLHCDVERFALDHGFEVFDAVCAARWQIKHHDRIHAADRGRYIGTEILFIKTTVPPEALLPKAFTLALFGFYNAARTVLAEAQDQALRPFDDAIISAQRQAGRSPSAFIKRLKATLKRIRHRG